MEEQPSAEAIQYNRYLQDKEEYGLEQTGEYKGIRWIAQRPYSTYWCGYIEVNNEYDVINLDDVAHGTITGGCSTNNPTPGRCFIGFDCAHYNDYNPPLPEIKKLSIKLLHKKDGVFKDFPFVLNIIKNMIDKYLQDSNEES